MISLFATTLALWSRTNFAPPSEFGTAKANGFVPITGLFPPAGAIDAGEFVKPIATNPDSASCST